MKSKIRSILKQIEKKEKVKIIFAVENGSRAWRMESADSDYDVRFVFFHETSDYLKLKKPKQVIERPGKTIDIVGFDIFKFCELLSKSNPTTIEWLTSDIIYYGKQPEGLVKFAKKSFNPKAVFHHYQSMCKANYMKYLKSKNKVTYKKYLYAYRGLINAKYVKIFKKIPGIDFVKTIKSMKKHLNSYVINKLLEIIEKKKQGKEKDIVQNIVKLDKDIESFIKKQESTPTVKKADIEKLNKEILKIIK